MMSMREPRYLLKQPEKLEKLAMSKLGDWIEMETKNLIPIICEAHQRNQSQADVLLWQRIKIIRYKLDSDVPRLFFNEIADNAIRALSRLHTEAASSSHSAYPVRLYVIRQMVQALFTKKLTKLNIFDGNYSDLFLTSLFYSKASLLTSPTYLEAKYYTEDEMIMFLGLKYLKLHSSKCTINIIKCITQNCKLIEELYVTGTDLSVNDDAVVLLTQLSNLRVIKLSPTRISSVGLENLLLSCKQIEHIDCNLKFNYALNNIIINNIKEVLKIKILALIHNQPTIKLRKFFEICPYIETLEIKNVIGCLYLDSITELKHLCNLKISGFCFDSKFFEMLKEIGRNLVHLEISDSYVNLNVWKVISQECPNLERLTFNHCFLIENKCLGGCTKSSTSLNCSICHPVLLETQPFKHLKRLTCNFVLRYQRGILIRVFEELAFLFETCLNIEYIHFSSNVHMPSNFLLTVLEKNPMTFLRTLEIGSQFELTRETIDLLIENCINHLEIIKK